MSDSLIKFWDKPPMELHIQASEEELQELLKITGLVLAEILEALELDQKKLF
jgi:hypothetical protein